MEPTKIDLEEWYATGRGGYADSYFHKTDESLILKLNFIEFGPEKAYNEYARSKAVHDLGIPCPEPLAFVTDGSRFGLISRRIVGKKSLTRIVSEDPSRMDEMAKRLAGMAVQLHATACNTDIFSDIAERYRKDFEACPYFPADVKTKLYKCLDELSPTTNCLHYDLHPGNVITADGKDYWIDLGDFGYGDPDLDFGILIVMCEWTPKKVLDDLIHLTREQCREFTRLYGNYYYGDRFNDPALLRKLYHCALLRYAHSLSFSNGGIAPLMSVFRKQKIRIKIIMTVLDVLVKERRHN